MVQQEAVIEEVRSQAVATLECDVPAGWSLDEWRAVRGMAREVTREPRWRPWRRRSRAARLARAASATEERAA
jgi:hypothetical protein